jgi:LytR cell envelope-related transcriptional attenuator
MASVSARRPLPALIFLLGLSLLTALVWWRVIHRSDSGHPTSEGTKTCESTTSKVVPQPASVTVKVLNSTDRLHLARSVSAQMGRLGFHMVAYDNDSSGTVNGVAEIRYGAKSTESATLISLYLPGATLVPTQEADTQIVVSLGTKFKTLATPAQAKAAMTSQHITQQPARPNPAAVTPTASATPSC